MLNRVQLIGNLGRDPEVRSFEGGNSVARFSIATSETYKDREGNKQTKTEWHTIVCWGRLAEIAQNYLTKGKKIYVEGKLETRDWKDKDGNDRRTTEIRCLNFLMLDSRQEGGGSNYSAPMPGNNEAPVTTNMPASDGVDDDLPF